MPAPINPRSALIGALRPTTSIGASAVREAAIGVTGGNPPAPPASAPPSFALPGFPTPGTPPADSGSPTEPATTAPPPAATAVGLTRATISPAALAGLAVRPEIFVRPLAEPASRTFTQLATDAVAQLRAAPRDTLSEAVRTLQAKNVAAGAIMSLLERRTRIGEVLSGSASRWSAETVGDFAAAFQMDASRTAVMDLIVALAILNDAELEAELRQENLPPTTPQDLLQNRRIVYQYPPPGTELTPPYVILVAVEHQDFTRAEEAVGAILGQLAEFAGYRMPRDAAARLG